MTSWADLDQELQRWRDAGETPTFWWRDDDTNGPSDALQRLLALSARHDLPLHLAVVPKGLSPELASCLRSMPHVLTLQHGYAHCNNEPAEARASEIGENRALAATLSDLRAGWEILTAAELPGLLPALAPPWNRIGDKVLPHLPALGYRLLSTMHARSTAEPVPGLKQVNIHFDPIRWKSGPEFRGVAGILRGITEHLYLRRLGLVDKTEPTGLSTHHLQTSDEVWGFLETLLERLSRPDAGRWCRLAEFLQDSQNG